MTYTHKRDHSFPFKVLTMWNNSVRLNYKGPLYFRILKIQDKGTTKKKDQKNVNIDTNIKSKY